MSIIHRSVATNYNIPEDAMFPKIAAACVPFVGLFISAINRAELERNLAMETNPDRMVKLIDVKNQYLAADVVNVVNSIAMIVTRIAYRVLFPSLGVTWALGILLAYGAVQAYRIYSNTQKIEKLQTTGYCPGMVITE